MDEIKDAFTIFDTKIFEFAYISISALLTMPKPLTVWITRNCGKF